MKYRKKKDQPNLEIKKFVGGPVSLSDNNF